MKSAVTFVTIEEEYQGQRLDNFLMNRLKGLPKSRLYRLIRKGEVRVNKKRADVSYKLQAGDLVRLPPVELEVNDNDYHLSPSLARKLRESILFENQDLMIVQKPAGIPVHAGSKVAAGMVEMLRLTFPEIKALELAHRLDRDTSGCLLLAKKRSVLKQLHDLFREGKVTKEYLTLVCGRWPQDKKTVRLSLLKNQLEGGERMVQVSEAGKIAVTHFHVEKYFSAATLLAVKLETARSHQIRVHTSHFGHAIAMDDKYGDRAFNQFIKQHGGKRMFLHAARIQFKYGDPAVNINVEAPLPEDLQKVLENLNQN